jgi:DNA-binding transcriptional regulator YhcF (GntR family)
VEISIDTSSPVPPFEQLRTRIAGAVASGELPAGTKLATVRQMAADLGVAANTVARSYRELEADGVVVTHGRRGTFVRSAVLDDAADDALDTSVRTFVDAVRRAGLTRAEATLLVERAWPR